MISSPRGPQGRKAQSQGPTLPSVPRIPSAGHVTCSARVPCPEFPESALSRAGGEHLPGGSEDSLPPPAGQTVAARLCVLSRRWGWRRACLSRSMCKGPSPCLCSLPAVSHGRPCLSLVTSKVCGAWEEPRAVPGIWPVHSSHFLLGNQVQTKAGRPFGDRLIVQVALF